MIRSCSLAGSTGARMTDTPPCRSRPRIGVLSVATLKTNVTITISTTPINEVHRRRRIGVDQASSAVFADSGSSASTSVGAAGSPSRDGLALDRGAGDADLDVVVDLEPEPIVAVLARDGAEDAGGGDDLVAHLDRSLEILLLANPAPLRPDQEEIHRERDQQEDAELDDGATAST